MLLSLPTSTLVPDSVGKIAECRGWDILAPPLQSDPWGGARRYWSNSRELARTVRILIGSCSTEYSRRDLYLHGPKWLIDWAVGQGLSTPSAGEDSRS